MIDARARTDYPFQLRILFWIVTAVLVATILLATMVLSARTASAHPHVWIDLQTKVVLDASGKISGLKVIWKLDELYSAYVVEDLAREPDDAARKEGLAKLAADTEANLAEYDYFVRVLADKSNEALKIKEPMRVWVDDNHLWMDFMVGFDAPLDPQKQVIRYAVSDPSYYIEITYAPDVDIKKLGVDPIFIEAAAGTTSSCEYVVERAEPTFESMSLASSLDKDDSAPVGLGDIFAEWVQITCP